MPPNIDFNHTVCPSCLEVIDLGEIVTCAECDRVGCLRCFQVVNDTDNDEMNTNFACNDDCELAWLEGLQASEERSHVMYQDWIGRKIEEARTRAEAKTQATYSRENQ